MASRRKRGPVAFRPRLSAGLALSAKSKHTPTVLNTRISKQMGSSECSIVSLKRSLNLSFRDQARMTIVGRKSPLGGYGWISSPERRETATFGHSVYSASKRLQERAPDTSKG